MKISIIIPVYKTEEVGYIYRTISGIERTIGLPLNEYTVTLVGTLPGDMFKTRLSTSIKWSFQPTDKRLGPAKNQGAEYAMGHFNPDVLVFMDAHMNFFDKQSANWGQVVYDFIMNHPNAAASPAISLYDMPVQRGYGVISDITEDDIEMDLKWKWVGEPPDNDAPFEVPGLCGCFMAMKPKTFKDSIVGYTPPLAIDDREFSIRIWLLGKDMYSIPQLSIGHRFASGYSDFSTERAIDWGMGMLLYTFLNLGSDMTMRLYEKGIHSTPDKAESLRRATTPYWKQVRQEILRKSVRTPEQYFRRFS